MLIQNVTITTILLYLATGEMPFHTVNACIKTPWIMNVCRPVSDIRILWRACNLAPLAFQVFSHTCTYTFIYPPTHPHTPTATCSSMTKMQIVHFYRIAQCTMVMNVPCAWQFICKASSNTLCTLFVQTKSSTCNYETPQRRSGQFDNTARTHFSSGLRNNHWSTSSRKQHEMITGSQYSGQPTWFCSWTQLPFRRRNRDTSAWPFAAASRSGVVPHCT